MPEGIQTYEVGIVWYRFWYRSEPIIVSHRGKRREIYSSKNEMECPASMANHMQKNLGHTLSRVSTLSTGKDRFQDVYRHKARYRFWDWYRFFKENANCSFLKNRECRPLALCSTTFVEYFESYPDIISPTQNDRSQLMTALCLPCM